MIIDNPGTYTLKYTATDSCGKTTTVDRELVVALPPEEFHTVLYTDGTFIINESSYDRNANIARHGEVTNEYVPFDPNGATDIDKYIFSVEADRPWNDEREAVLSVEIGTLISPTSLSRWFQQFSNCTSIDLDNIDSQNITNIAFAFSSCTSLIDLDTSGLQCSLTGGGCQSAFANCERLPNIDLSGIDTSSATTMRNMFYHCESMTRIDLSNFLTPEVTNTQTMFSGCYMVEEIDISSAAFPKLTKNFAEMFRSCGNLVTIFANTGFDLSSRSANLYMFDGDSNIVGGQNTGYIGGSSVYAHIDGGTSNPGYFTLKSA